MMTSPFGEDRDVTDATFKGVDAAGQRLDRYEFEGCVFDGVQLAGATLAHCRFVDCVFVRSDLSNVKLSGTRFRDVKWQDCKLLGVSWVDADTVASSSFERCVLTYGNFSGIDLRKTKLVDCVAREVELAATNLADADCRGTDFAGARFHKTTLERADFRGARGYALSPTDNAVKGMKVALPDALSLLAALGVDIGD